MTQQLLLTCARVAVVALALRGAVADATCYYPDGKVADSAEKPCSTADGVACCPENWECLDNGLCHYTVGNLYGTYSCTDQSWKAAGCPSNLCTYDLTRVGAESMTQCSDHNNDWCCNGDNVNVHCCEESPAPRPFFELNQGQVYATIGTGNLPSTAPTLSTITGLASGSATGEAASSTPAPSGSSAQSSGGGSSQSQKSSAAGSSKTPDAITSQFTSVSSGSAGIQTVVVTSVIRPSASSTNGAAATTPSSSHSHLGVIVGCAVGIPLALALAGILLWMLRKRRQQKANPYNDPPEMYSNGNESTLNGSPDFAGGAKLQKPGKEKPPVYKSEVTGASELPGQSVGPERPISSIPGRAELQSGSGFEPGVIPHAPHLVGVGGGTGQTPPTSSWGSAPPGYSPGMNAQGWQAPHDGAVEADSTALPTHAAAAPATEGGRYIPYRPPPGHAAATTATGAGGAAAAGGGGHLQDVPEAAEMSAVKTPPA